MYLNIIVGLGAIWLLALTYFVFRIWSHYRKITTRTKSGSIDTILEQLIEKSDLSAKELAKIKEGLESEINKSNNYIQRVGFARFNAFHGAVGEQSFVVSLLDGQSSGIVLNFMHTRDGVRVLAKRVRDGKGQEYALSTEEEAAIKKAL